MSTKEFERQKVMCRSNSKLSFVSMACTLPLAVSIARVQEVFDTEGRCNDANAERLIRSAAMNLIDYIKNAICPKITLEGVLRGKTKEC